jgi:Rieske Fe-S protein
MTHGTLAGILITDLIFRRPNPWEKLYDPSRKSPVMHELGEFFRHNVQVGAQYKDWITGGQVSDIEDIPLCQGAIIREGFSKIAAYKDENGKVHACSAVCPHLGGIVTWNELEKVIF